MLDYRILKTILLLKHLNELNAVWEDQVVNRRISELEEEHEKVQEYRELSAEYSKLFDRMQNINNKEQWEKALYELDSLVGSKLLETDKYYYLAGFNDAMRIFNHL